MHKLPNIYGFNKTSEAGVNIFSPSIFLKGCDLRCPYCMNSKLLTNKVTPIDIQMAERYIKEEKCDWIMISGGEPTVTPIELLINLIKECQSWGCKVGLSTNGNNPEILENILLLLNYVALDIKCYRADDILMLGSKLRTNHDYLIRVIRSLSKIVENKSSRVDFSYEVRTTLFPLFIDKTAINEIGSLLRSDTNWVLQQFRHSDCMLSQKAYDIKPYSEEEINDFLGMAKKYCNNVWLRYV